MTPTSGSSYPPARSFGTPKDISAHGIAALKEKCLKPNSLEGLIKGIIEKTSKEQAKITEIPTNSNTLQRASFFTITMPLGEYLSTGTIQNKKPQSIMIVLSRKPNANAQIREVTLSTKGIQTKSSPKNTHGDQINLSLKDKNDYHLKWSIRDLQDDSFDSLARSLAQKFLPKQRRA